MAQEAKAEKAEGKETTAQEKLEKHLQKIVSVPAGSKTKKSSGSEELLSETILLDWLADINVFKQIQSKRKKGKSLTGGEWTFLVFHKIGEFFGHLAKIILKLGRPFLKLLHWAFKMVIEALKDLGLYKYAKAIMTLVMVIAVIWFTWEAFHYGLIRPVEMLWSKIPWGQLSHREPVTSASDVPSPGITLPAASPIVRSSELGSSQLKTSSSSLRTSNSPPVSAYQPSIPFNTASPTNASGTLYDPKILELEIAAIPSNSVIKDYVFQPDEGMPADLAVSRLQDLTDPDKYTLMIGSAKLKILSFNPSNTDFIITYQSTDLLGVLGGSGPRQINFFWEDVQYIHINEIDCFTPSSGSPDVHYQCTAVSKSAKDSLTFLCGSQDDLENLVSALEYFIRHSRLGHDAQPAGMPFLTQGSSLNNDCVVEKLWANSPMGKAGAALGDHLWSVGYITPKPQSRKELEAGLQSNSILYSATNADWEQAMIAFRAPGQGNPFKPRLRKVTLSAN
jgi:hypothetical protein